MTNKKIAKRSLIASIMAMFLSVAMFVGTTFAWFTDSVSNGGNTIVSGNLDVELWHSSYFSSAEASPFSVGFGFAEENTERGGEEVDSSTKLFLNKNAKEILWEPGMTAVENFRIKNVGNLALKWKFALEVINATKTDEGRDLTEIINLSMDEITYAENGLPMGTTILPDQKLADGYTFEGTLLAGENYNFSVGLQWVASELDNLYNVTGGLKVQLGVSLVATQLGYESDCGFNDNGYDNGAQYPVIDKWENEPDFAWFTANPNASEYTIKTAEEFIGLVNLVDGTDIAANAVANIAIPAEGQLDFEFPVTFDGKTIKLDCDVDLGRFDANGERISFDAIGCAQKNTEDIPFKGIFDGQGHSIYNMYQSGWAFGYEWGSYGAIGMFAVVEDATIKNLTIDGYEGEIEGGNIAIIAGKAKGNCVFENITIKNSKLGTYNNGIGGIVGWSLEGDYTFKNIDIQESVVLGGLWGSFDASIGGVIAEVEPADVASYKFENVNVACRIDAYNDCTASYDYYNYRMCGMLIGNMDETTTIDGSTYADLSKYNLVFDNVTVTYGEWANYHYCRGNGRAKRVEAGYAYDGIPADYNHLELCTTHCQELIAFDQLFGGTQLGCKGIVAHKDVKVVYNNK